MILPIGLNLKLSCVAAGAGSTPQLLRACIIHACMATLLEVGAVAANPEAWTALHLKPVCSSQAHEAARQLQNLVLRELPEAMLQSSSPASAHAAEWAAPFDSVSPVLTSVAGAWAAAISSLPLHCEPGAMSSLLL